MNNRMVASAIPGAKVSLKQDVLKHTEVRQWIFQCLEKDDIAWLMRENGLYGIGIDAELIDWQDNLETLRNSRFERCGDKQGNDFGRCQESLPLTPTTTDVQTGSEEQEEQLVDLLKWELRQLIGDAQG